MDESSKTAVGTVFIFLLVTQGIATLFEALNYLLVLFTAGDEPGTVGISIWVIIWIIAKLCLFLILVILWIIFIKKKVKWPDLVKDPTIRKASGWLLLLSGMISLFTYAAYNWRTLITMFNAKDMDSSYVWAIINNLAWILLTIGQVAVAIRLIVWPKTDAADVPGIAAGRNVQTRAAAGIILFFFLASGIVVFLKSVAQWILGRSAAQVFLLNELLILLIYIAIVITAEIVMIRQGRSFREYYDDRTICLASGALIAACGFISLVSGILNWAFSAAAIVQAENPAQLLAMMAAQSKYNTADLLISLIQTSAGLALAMRKRKVIP
jgi:hypothetical protein